MAVMSDLHLGMCGCKAAEVLAYLRSIDPEILVLNGDIVDVWQFKKYFPPEHMLVAWKLIDVVSSSAELRSTQELFQALLAEIVKGWGTKKPDQLAGLPRLKVQAP